MRAFPEAETSNSGVKRSRHYVAKRKINVARRRLVDSVTAPLNAAKLLKKKNWDPSLVQELSNAPGSSAMCRLLDDTLVIGQASPFYFRRLKCWCSSQYFAPMGAKTFVAR
jgi:hypothetical protein